MTGSPLRLRSTRHRAASSSDAQEIFHANGWTDGLPVVPPTEEAVAQCLDWALLDPDHLLGVEPVRSRPITAEKVAVNTVLAGGLAPHFPVVATAIMAMLEEPFLLHGATSSTGGCAVFTVVNGPVRRELAMATDFNVLGNSDRASAVIGRAIRLCLINLLDVRPGGVDRSTLGHPGKFSYCVAENEEASPWPSLAASRGVDPNAGAVTVMAALGPRQVMNEWTTRPEDVLETIAAEMRANQLHYSIWPGNYAVVVPPQLLSVLADAGWTRGDVQRFVYERARVRRGDWADVGKGSVVKDRADREYGALEQPDQLLLVAAGGPAGGFAAVIPPWLGTKSRAVTLPIAACVDC